MYSPIFAEYTGSFSRPATYSIPRTPTSHRSRKSEVSIGQARIRAFEAARRAISPPPDDEFSPEYNLSLEFHNADNLSSFTEDIMEDVARALRAQKRAKARISTPFPMVMTDNPDSDISPLASSASSSSAQYRPRAWSSMSASSSTDTRQDTQQPFPIRKGAETVVPSTPPRPSRSKSSKWLRNLTPKSSTRNFGDTSVDPIDSPAKQLAPLSRFNPFIRARSESLSSITEHAETPSPRRRTHTLEEKGNSPNRSSA